ncbi:hypothetical protein CBL_02073 [Carabus blaptoides fortunei]
MIWKNNHKKHSQQKEQHQRMVTILRKMRHLQKEHHKTDHHLLKDKLQKVGKLYMNWREKLCAPLAEEVQAAEGAGGAAPTEGAPSEVTPAPAPAEGDQAEGAVPAPPAEGAPADTPALGVVPPGEAAPPPAEAAPTPEAAAAPEAPAEAPVEPAAAAPLEEAPAS